MRGPAGRVCSLALICTGFLLLIGKARADGQKSKAPSLADQTIVVYNSADRDSVELARYYAARRAIPDDHVVGLNCPLGEEISREEFNRQIARPLREKFSAHNWWTIRTHVGAISGPSVAEGGGVVSDNKIRFVALIRGVPLKIREEAAYSGDVQDASPMGRTNAASVDSELTVLGLNTPQISGVLKNPFYESFVRFGDSELSPMMLVCRLDGPTPPDVMRMIDDSIRAEKSGLWGWACIDARGIADAGYKLGDDWLFAAARALQEQEFPMMLDRQEPIFPAGMVLPRMAIYEGWYAGDFSGAMAGSRFEPGAVACHIHSFSASTLRSPVSGWCGPLITAGAAAVMGNVYEPYLGFTVNLEVFTERLLRGWTFAESSWAGMRVLSWMTVNVGDPLYRPFAVLAASKDAVAPSPVGDFRKSVERNIPDGSTTYLAEAWANRKLATDDATGAAGMFELALAKTNDPNTIARLTWTYGQSMLAMGNKAQAIALVKTNLTRVGMSGAGTFLQGWLNQLQP